MSSQPGRAPAVGFIFVTLVLSIVGFGLLIPVLPKLIVEFRGGDLTSGSHAYGVIVGVYAFMQFIGSPILGSLSDRFGRRTIILIATAGSAIDYGVLATGNAYIADVTPPEKRAGAFGLIGAAFGLGFIIGPALGGLLGEIDLRLPFWVAAGCSAANWIFGYFVLPESLARDHRRPFSWARANPIGALAALKRFPAVLGPTGGVFMLMLAQNMLFSTWALYTDHRYGWSPRAVGFSLMFIGTLSAVVQAALVRRIVPALGEKRAVVLGMSVAMTAQLCYGLATQGWMVYAIMSVAAFGGLAMPALQAYITKHVPPTEQGAVQGVYGGLGSLAAIPGPVIATWSFGWAIGPHSPVYLPGIAFFEGAMLIAIALLLTLRAFRKDHGPPATAPS